MPSKSDEKRVATLKEATQTETKLNRFYFPSLGRHGLSVEASSPEEALEKATKQHEQMSQVTAQDSSNE